MKILESFSAKDTYEYGKSLGEKAKQGDDDTHETMGWLRVQGTNIDYPVYGKLSKTYSSEEVTESYLWSLNSDSDYKSPYKVVHHKLYHSQDLTKSQACLLQNV